MIKFREKAVWFWFALTALVCWSGSDLFSKIGCADARDRYSYLKMTMAVGLVMGLHAAYEVFIAGVEINAFVLLRYLPVSLLYISSMVIGYLGLRYIELSISSPICNSSGAIVAVLSILAFGISDDVPAFSLVAVALVCIGVVALGITEAGEDEELRAMRQDGANYQYAKSALAIVIPIIYCLLDAIGTFADSIVLETVDENSANVAYELTFLIAGICCAVYVLGIKKQKLAVKAEGPRLLGAVCETAGQFFYIFAIADREHVAFAAPIISSYCVLSVIWGRLFLKEKLSRKHYASIALVIFGIIILGVLDI